MMHNLTQSQIQYMDEAWQKDFGINLSDEKSDFEIDNNGNLVFLSKDSNNLKLSCISENGDFIWQQIINNQSGNKIGIDIVITPENNSIVLTQIDNVSSSILITQKFDDSGTLLWQSSDSLPANSKGIKVKLINDYIHILSSKKNNGYDRIFFVQKNIFTGFNISSFLQSSLESLDYKPIDFVYDTNGKIIVLSHKVSATFGFSNLIVLDTSLNLLSNQVVETSPGNHLPTSIKTYLNFCVVSGQAEINGKHGSISILDLNSLNLLGLGLNDLPNSIYNDFEVVNDQVYATGFFIDSLGQNRIFVESASLVGQTVWRKIMASPINDIEFEGIDLIISGLNDIYIIAKGTLSLTLGRDWLLYKFNNLGEITNKFVLDRTSQNDVNSKILSRNNEVYVSGSTTDDNDLKSTLVKIRTVSTDTIPNVDGEPSSRYNGYIRNYGQLKNYGLENDAAFGVNYYASSSLYLDAIMKDKIAFVQNIKVDTILHLYDVNRMDISFVNGNMEKQIDQNPNGLKRNFYQGNTTNSIVGVDEYESVYIPNLYPNINLKLTHNKVGIKMIFAKNFKGELDDISMNIEGASSVEINNNTLNIITPLNTIDFDQPYAYQYDASGTLIQYPAFFILDTLGNVSIDVPIYNPLYTLYIVVKDGDNAPETPKLLGDNMLWSTYFGENFITISRDVATDGNKNVYYTGQTTCPNFYNSTGLFPSFPKAAQYDAFIIKFNEFIVPNWFTFYGGSIGNNTIVNDPSEVATDICVNGDGSKIYIAGVTCSADLLLPNNPASTGYTGDQTNTSALGTNDQIYNDLFIARFDNNGQLYWNTYYGNDYEEISSDITLDRCDNLYVVGERNNTTPLLPLAGANNYTSGSGLLMKFNLNDALTWVNTWAGERIAAVITDPVCNVYFAGSTNNSSMPILNQPVEVQTQTYNGGNHDGFLACFTNAGLLTHSMYYGGNCGDFITGLGINNSNEIYAVGKTAYKAIGNNDCTGSTDLIVKGNGLPFIDSSVTNINHFIFKMLPFFNSSWGAQQMQIEHAGYFGGGGSEFELNNQFGLSYTEAVIAVHPQTGIFVISGATNSDFYNNSSIPMPFAQPQNYFFQPFRDSNSYFGLDAYLAAFNSDFELKYSTYFGDGYYSEGPSGIAFSTSDNRLFYCGNTGTFNGCPLITSDFQKLFVEEFDDSPLSLDFYQSTYLSGNQMFSEATWFALFDLNGLDIPGEPFNLGVNEINENSLFIYPNPASNTIQISASTILDEIFLFDLQGKLIQQVAAQNKDLTIDISGISSGTYIVQAKNSNGILISKFMKP
jgi:hypothetical protein